MSYKGAVESAQHMRLSGLTKSYVAAREVHLPSVIVVAPESRSM
jgi:hypothetical protein